MEATAVVCLLVHEYNEEFKEEMLMLAQVCSATFNEAKKIIPKSFSFRYPGDNFTFKLYHPQHMTIGCKSNYPLYTPHFSLSLLPPSLTHLTFKSFNQPINALLSLPLTHLTFGSSFSHPVDHLLPPSLLHLVLGNEFNQTVDHLPDELQLLSLGEDFDQDLDSLPHSLAQLSLAEGYNKEINNLPPNLTHFTINGHYYLTIQALPDSLTHLSIGHDLGDIPYFPPSLISLSLSHYVYQPRLPQMPPTLSILHYKNFALRMDNLPPSIVDIEVDKCIGNDFPPFLQHLKFAPTEDQVDHLPSTLQSLIIKNTRHSDCPITKLPPNLKKLTVNSPQIPVLPASLKELTLKGFKMDEPLVSLLPANLSHLTINNFHQAIDFGSISLISLRITDQYDCAIVSLPPTLKTLMMEEYTYPVKDLPSGLQELKLEVRHGVQELPASLKKLTLSGDFPIPLPALPEVLEELNLDDWYNHPLPELPASLKMLYVGTHYRQPLPSLPSSLKTLKVGLPKTGKKDEPPLPPLPPLPPSLTTLRLSVVSEPLTSLPPRLQRLEITTPHPLPPIPNSMQSLYVYNNAPK